MAVECASAKIPPLEATLLVVNSAFWSALAVVAVRAPHTGLLWLMGPILCTVASLGEPTRAARAAAQIRDFLLFGVLQFLFAAGAAEKAPVLLLVPAAVLFVGRVRRGNRAAAVIASSLMNLPETDAAAAGEMLVTVLLLAATAPLCGALLDRLLFGAEERRGPPPSPPIPTEILLRRAGALTTAIALMYALEWHFGHWIPLTVALLYLAAAPGEATRQAALTRSLAAVPGFAAALLYLATVSYSDYRLNYLAGFYLAGAFHYSFRRGDYFGFSVMYMVICCVLNDLLLEGSPLFANGWELLFQSAAGTAAGCAIAAAFAPTGNGNCRI